MTAGTPSRRPRPDAPGDPAAAALWAFSLGVYARPGVEPACLRLQDELGLDVNLLLLALHAGRCGRPLTDQDWSRLDARIAPLREHVIRPLREARRWLKDRSPAPVDAAGAAPGALRAAIAAVELQAEREAQSLLAAAFGGDRPSEDDAPPPTAERAAAIAAANLAGALRLRAPSALPGRHRDDLAALLRAAFAERAVDDLVRELDFALAPAGARQRPS